MINEKVNYLLEYVKNEIKDLSPDDQVKLVDSCQYEFSKLKKELMYKSEYCPKCHKWYVGEKYIEKPGKIKVYSHSNPDDPRQDIFKKVDTIDKFCECPYCHSLNFISFRYQNNME